MVLWLTSSEGKVLVYQFYDAVELVFICLFYRYSLLGSSTGRSLSRGALAAELRDEAVSRRDWKPLDASLLLGNTPFLLIKYFLLNIHHLQIHAVYMYLFLIDIFLSHSIQISFLSHHA